MTRVLLVAPFFAPDVTADGPLYDMLTQELKNRGYRVSVISAVPHYPSGRVQPEFRGKLIQREDRSGVQVTRVWVPSLDRSRLRNRLIVFLVYQTLAACVGLFRRFDVLIIGNPAFANWLPFLALCALRRKPTIYTVHEVYPDIGVKLGIFRHWPVIAVLEFTERFFCRFAKVVHVVSDVYKQQIERKNVPSEKIVKIYHWVDVNLITPQPRQNPLARRWRLDTAFVIQYAGTIGPTQGIETILIAAGLLRRRPVPRPLHFLLVGEGKEKVRIERLASEMGLKNVSFYPFQDRQLLPHVLASADVALLPLKRGFATDSAPSKLFSIMASARPAICSVDKDSDTWRMVERAGCGICIEPEDPEALANAIVQLAESSDLCARMGRNARSYVVQNHSQSTAGIAFDDLIARVLGHPKKSHTVSEEATEKSATLCNGPHP